MSVARPLWSAILLSALLAQCVLPAAAASAAPPQFAAALERVAGWQGGLQVSEARRAPAFTTTVGTIDLVPLGDADGDGHDDLAVLRTLVESAGDEDGAPVQTSAASAVSGADLATALWTFEPAEGETLTPLADGDGDGVLDFALARAAVSPAHGGGGGSLPVPFVWAGQAGFAFEGNATLASGADLSPLAQLRAAFRWTSTGAGAYPLVAHAGASQEEVRAEVSALLEAGRLADVAMTAEATTAGAAVLVTGVWGGTVEQDMAVEAHAPGGDEAARMSRDSDLLAVSLLPADVTGDGAQDLVFLEARLPLPANLMAGVMAPVPSPRELAPRPVLAAHDGLTGAELWTVERDPVDLYAELQPSPGDLDGDGMADLAFFEVWTETTDGPFSAPHARTSVLSGADGRELARAEGDGGMVFLMPFGDTDGEAGDEALRLDLDFSSPESSFTVSLVGLDLQPRWSFDAEGTLPLNLRIDPYTGLPAGFSDLDGDGAPDILLATMPERPEAVEHRKAGSGEADRSRRAPPPEPRAAVDDVAVRLVGGRDGTAVWQRDLAGLLDVRTLPDASGVGDGDLVAVRLEGLGDGADLSVGVLSYEILRGESGAVARAQVLRAPGNDPLPASAMLQAQGGAMGDLDGDGAEDVGVHVAIAQASAVVGMEGGRSRMSLNQSWLLFSGASGSPLGAFYNAKSLDAPVRAAPLQAVPASDARVQESPGPAVGAIAAIALAAALLALRRRPVG